MFEYFFRTSIFNLS